METLRCLARAGSWREETRTRRAAAMVRRIIAETINICNILPTGAPLRRCRHSTERRTRMETIKPVAAPAVQTRENEEGAAQTDLRALSDYEMWFVGGGEDTPHW